jgi:ATP-binding cassette subfamily B (MDR/TAP) protein 1
MDQVSQSQIEDAARRANVHDFILTLPNGYATNLGENAGLVSGGQAQRIAIARATLTRRPILVLDECTSALDAENQRIVMDSIRSIKQGRTTIVVTHKLDMMKMCDRLLVVKAGKVVESGTYEVLLARPQGAFKELASAGEWLM